MRVEDETSKGNREAALSPLQRRGNAAFRRPWHNMRIQRRKQTRSGERNGGLSHVCRLFRLLLHSSWLASWAGLFPGDGLQGAPWRTPSDPG